MTALALARQFELWNRDHPNEPRRILMLERGTWWTTPVGTVQDPEVATYDFLVKQRHQPAQVWPSQNHFRGVLDILSRCRRHAGNPDGLYDFMALGRRWFFGLLPLANDGVSVLRASGVGGGSLVYSNITIEPPDLIFKDPRWDAVEWSVAERQRYYEAAREATLAARRERATAAQSHASRAGARCAGRRARQGESRVARSGARVSDRDERADR